MFIGHDFSVNQLEVFQLNSKPHSPPLPPPEKSFHHLTSFVQEIFLHGTKVDMGSPRILACLKRLGPWNPLTFGFPSSRKIDRARISFTKKLAFPAAHSNRVSILGGIPSSVFHRSFVVIISCIVYMLLFMNARGTGCCGQRNRMK